MKYVNYYNDELAKLAASDYAMSIRLVDGTGNATKNINLNEVSLPIIIAYLKELSNELRINSRDQIE